MYIQIIQFVSMVLFFWFGTVVVFSGIRGQTIGAGTLAIFSISLTTFIFVTWML